MYPSRGFPPRKPRIRENVNEAIRAREVRAVFPDGTVEILPTQVAVRKAQDMGLDLIVIAPTAEPPVAKAMDYGQWQYENKKKQHEAKKKQHIIQVKELKFRPNTDDHDYDFKKNHAIRFLKEGNRVKAVVQFRGREIAHVDLGKKLLLRFAADLTGVGSIEGQPKLEGRNAHIILSPVKAGVPAGKEKETPAPSSGVAQVVMKKVIQPAPPGSPSGPPSAGGNSGGGNAPPEAQS
jgi:translation initiation factor IF-3